LSRTNDTHKNSFQISPLAASANLPLRIITMLSRIVLALLVLSFPAMSSAFPSSVGSCQAGISAIQQGAHASVQQRDDGGKGIAYGGFEVWIDGELVYEDVVFQFTAGVEHAVQLVANRDIMRGFLLRLESTDGQDTRGVLQTTDASKAEVPFFCDNVEAVGGLGHVSSDSKTLIEGTLYMPTASNEMILDVTTVVSTEYSLRSGEWYYSPFKLQAVAPGTVIVNQAGVLATSAPVVTQCVNDGGMCTSDAECCSSGRCIRGDSQDIYTTGACVLPVTQAAPPLSYSEQDAVLEQTTPPTAQPTAPPTIAPTPLPPMNAPTLPPTNWPTRLPLTNPPNPSPTVPLTPAPTPVEDVFYDAAPPVVVPVVQEVVWTQSPSISPVEVEVEAEVTKEEEEMSAAALDVKQGAVWTQVPITAAPGAVESSSQQTSVVAAATTSDYTSGTDTSQRWITAFCTAVITIAMMVC
jgi:hypothetical protein